MLEYIAKLWCRNRIPYSNEKSMNSQLQPQGQISQTLRKKIQGTVAYSVPESVYLTFKSRWNLRVVSEVRNTLTSREKKRGYNQEEGFLEEGAWKCSLFQTELCLYKCVNNLKLWKCIKNFMNKQKMRSLEMSFLLCPTLAPLPRYVPLGWQERSSNSVKL